MFRIACHRGKVKPRTLGQDRVAVAWIVSAIIVAGCQPSDSLHGTVTYNGEAVENGSITFLSADGSGPGFGAEVRDGKYSTDKAKLGEHTAVVRGLEKPGPVSKEESIRQREQKDNPHGIPVDYIPEDAVGNNRSVDIESGQQTLDFALEGPPRSE